MRALVAQTDPLRRRDDVGPVTLLYVDLDSFKTLNDAYGHIAGDALLRDVGAAIRAAVRASDPAARVGGDEFAIVMPRTDAGAATAERLLDGVQAIAARYPRARGGASVGIAERQDPSESIGELLRRADDAMYRAKASGKGRIVCCTPGGRPAE